MSLGVMEQATRASEKPAVGGVVRTPFWWTSLGQPLFAWLHTQGDQLHFDHGVLIAAPIGHEQLHAHRSLRRLADALARRGIPTLRFDWHGTGDSAGVDEDPDRLSVWTANLRDAAGVLRNRLGLRRVSVVGLRFGATLAATAFSAGEIENLVLWFPVINGRTYVRELTAIDRTSEIPPPTSAEMSDIEPAGFTVTEETCRDMAQRNLLQASPLPCRTLIVIREETPGEQRLGEAYCAAGVPVDRTSCPGFADMMAPPHKGSLPEAAIDRITGWLDEAIAAPHERCRPFSPMHSGTTEMATTHRPEARKAPDARRRLKERAVRISDAPDLFGIVTEPAEASADDRPTIVLLNAGAAYRIAPGRLHVHLARRLAAEGFRCLRFDANGLGDSIAAEGTEENQTYSATVFRDVDLTLRSLRERGLGTRFVLTGLCSGAYNAFQSAVSLSEPALVESVLINPLTYFWRDGMMISESSDRQLLVQNYYFESALSPRKWLKLLSGKTKIGWRGAAGIVARRLGFVRRRSSSSPIQDRPPYSHPVRDDLAADLDEAMARGRDLAMFFAEGDPGYAILMGKAGRKAKQLQRQGRLHIEFLPNADHNFSRRTARQALIEALVGYLRRRY
jgi:alpha-beta hydrolase superfamily lysophospholipase